MSRKVSSDRLFLNIISYVVISIFALLCIIPFYFIIVASFSSEKWIMTHGFSFFFNDFSIEGYKLVLKNPTMILRAYANTMTITIVGTFIAVLLATMTGFVLSRPEFKWRNRFSLFFYFTTLFSGGLTPWYIICTRYLGFKNNYLGLILPLIFSVWNMIIAKNFMKSIPNEISESAKVDGANELIIFFRLFLPLAKPLVATLGLFTALYYWNDWYNCMLFISQSKDYMYTLQYFLQGMLLSIENLRRVAEMSGIPMPVLPTQSMKMAMTIVVTGPIIFLYPFIQKFFIKGLTIGAVKG